MGRQFIGLSPETAERLAEMLDWFDNANPTVNYRPRRNARQPVIQTSDTFIVKVTSTTQTDNMYPAILQIENDLTANPPTFTDADGNIGWAVDPRGGTLTTGEYLARMAYKSRAADGKLIVEVVGSAASGLVVQTTGGATKVSNVNKITLDPAADWLLTNPNPGEAQIDLAESGSGLTTTFTQTLVSAVSCSAGTLSVTTGTLTIVVDDGLITSISFA